MLDSEMVRGLLTVLFDRRGSFHVDIRHVNSADEFCSPYRVQHRSHPMLHGVLHPRYTELLLVVGSRTCLYSRHRSGLDPGTHSVTYIWHCTGEAFLSSDDTKSVLRSRYLCLDPWNDLWLQHVCRPIPPDSAHPLFRSMVATRQHWSVVSSATLLLCLG